jgi:hypothetical protein
MVFGHLFDNDLSIKDTITIPSASPLVDPLFEKQSVAIAQSNTI